MLLYRKKRNQVTLGFNDRHDADSQITMEEWIAVVVLRDGLIPRAESIPLAPKLATVPSAPPSPRLRAID
jgi:hypothetical protein